MKTSERQAREVDVQQIVQMQEEGSDARSEVERETAMKERDSREPYCREVAIDRKCQRSGEKDSGDRASEWRDQGRRGGPQPGAKLKHRCTGSRIERPCGDDDMGQVLEWVLCFMFCVLVGLESYY